MKLSASNNKTISVIIIIIAVLTLFITNSFFAVEIIDNINHEPIESSFSNDLYDEQPIYRDILYDSRNSRKNIDSKYISVLSWLCCITATVYQAFFTILFIILSLIILIAFMEILIIWKQKTIYH